MTVGAHTWTPVDAGLIDELRHIVGGDHVLARPGELRAYARDATPMHSALPEVVVLPGNTEAVAAVLRLATERRIPVVPRGAGTNLSAATVAIEGGIVLCLTRMSSILEVSAAEHLAVVEPGVTTARLAAAAADEGLLYPPDPGSRTVATVGGNIATNAGGLRGLKYGVTRNYVLGLEAVLATGEVIQTGGRLWKDVAGYDLTRLLTGSEGTLAVITRATVALVPAPATSRTGVAYFHSLADAGRAVAAVLSAGIVPATMEFLDNACIRAVEEFAKLGLDRAAGALLLFGDDGEERVTSERLDRMAELCRSNGATSITTATSVVESEALLHARRCSLPALARLGTATILEDVTVPRPRIAEMVDLIDASAKKHGVLIATFGHAGDGNLHPTAIIDATDTRQAAAVHRAFDEIFQTAIELGGTITGEHGVGITKRPYLDAQLGAAQVALQRRVKHAFDPAGVLNPGKTGS